MLNVIKRVISKELKDTRDFPTFYQDYVSSVQDMDIDNEIMPLIRKQSTEYIRAQQKIYRKKDRLRKKVINDISQ